MANTLCFRNHSPERIADLQGWRDARRANGWKGEPVRADLYNWRHLHNPEHDLGYIVADLSDHAYGRDWIQTSIVVAIEGDLAITLNSVYRLVGAGISA